MAVRPARALPVYALAVLLAGASFAAAQDQDDGPPAEPCAGVTVSSTPPSTDMTAKGYSARQVLDLNFEVVLTAPTRGLALKLFTPNGHLYQQIDVPVAPAGSSEVERRLQGYPFPVKVAKVRASPRAAEGSAEYVVGAPPFPVAGTTIVSSSLYGKWRAEAWVQGAAEACSTAFAILP